MPQPKAESHPRIVFGGDVMLGRLAKEEILARGPTYPLGSIAPFMRSADLAIVNLECAMTNRQAVWEGEAKAFYFGAPPAAAESLVDAGVNLVSLANNHSLDFGRQGLVDTLVLLRDHGIAVAGAGINEEEALTPAVVERVGIRFGMAAFCDHQEDFAAGSNLPGIAYLDLEDEPSASKRFGESLDRMRELGVEWPILSLHWGPNMVWKPSRRLVRLGRLAIDMGYAALFGHSAHIFHGIEVYKSRPIFYSTGDLVDDYAVDPEFENDGQLLFEVTLSGLAVQGISLLPVIIDDCRTSLAAGREFDRITRRAVALCAEMGTRVRREGNRLIVANLEEADHGPQGG